MHRAARDGERPDPRQRHQRELMLQRRQRGPAQRTVRTIQIYVYILVTGVRENGLQSGLHHVARYIMSICHDEYSFASVHPLPASAMGMLYREHLICTYSSTSPPRTVQVTFNALRYDVALYARVHQHINRLLPLMALQLVFENICKNLKVHRGHLMRVS